MSKRNTFIRHNALTVTTQLSVSSVTDISVLTRHVDVRKSVNGAFDGISADVSDGHAMHGIFVESIWSNKLWRESIFSNQL